MPGHGYLRLVSKCGASRNVKLRKKSKEIDEDMVWPGQGLSEVSALQMWSAGKHQLLCSLLNFLLKLSFENNADSSLEHE